MRTSVACRAREHLRYLGQGEAVLGTEGEHHGVVVRRRLQLEVERHAEALAQGQAEGPVDAAAERRVHDELGALGLVEDPLDDDAVPGGQHAERGKPGRRGRPPPGRRPLPTRPPATAPPARAPSPSPAASNGSSSARSQPTSIGQLGRAGRGLAQPERDGGGQVAGVGHPDRAGLHLDDPPRVGAEEEDVAGRGLDGEVLVDRADGDPVRIEHHPVVARLGDGASAGQGGQAGPPAGSQPSVDRIVMEVGSPPARARSGCPRTSARPLRRSSGG